MSKEIIYTSIEIHATRERVWNEFSKFDAYSSWNPFLTKVEGKLEVGERLNITAGGMSFKPKLLKMIPGVTMQWLGHFLIPGLFDGKHEFEIKEKQEGRLVFVHKEEFRGLLVPLFKKKLQTETKEGFMSMNMALKERCEKQL